MWVLGIGFIWIGARSLDEGKLTVVEHDLIQARQPKPATVRPAFLIQRLTTIFEPADK